MQKVFKLINCTWEAQRNSCKQYFCIYLLALLLPLSFKVTKFGLVPLILCSVLTKQRGNWLFLKWFSVKVTFKPEGSVWEAPTGSFRNSNTGYNYVYITDFDPKDWPVGTKIYADIIFDFIGVNVSIYTWVRNNKNYLLLKFQIIWHEGIIC